MASSTRSANCRGDHASTRGTAVAASMETTESMVPHHRVGNTTPCRRLRARAATVPDMRTVPTAPLVAAGLIGGFAAGRYLHRRDLAGVVSAVALVGCLRPWQRAAGPGVAAGLAAGYAGGLAASHPLAKKIGAWPAVLAVSGASAGAAYVLADRKALRR